MTSTISMAARNLILLVGGLVMLVLSSPKMSLVVLLAVPLVVALMIVLGRRLRKASRLAQDRLADVSVQAEESVSAMRTVQAFARQGLVRDRFDDAVGGSLDAALSRGAAARSAERHCHFHGVWRRLGHPVGGRAGLSRQDYRGDLSLCSMPFWWPPRPGSCLTLRASCKLAAQQNVLPPCCMPMKACCRPRSRARSTPRKIACWSRMSVLPIRPPPQAGCHHVDFTIGHGERVALVGPLAQANRPFTCCCALAIRGRAHYGRRPDIRDLALDDLRRHIGIVSQDTALFSTSVRQYIVWPSDADEADMVAAAQQAETHGFITELPQGYDTLVGEKGVRVLASGKGWRLRAPYCATPAVASTRPQALDARSEARCRRLSIICHVTGQRW